MNKSDKILTLSAIILVGFAASVIFHYVQGFYMHKIQLFSSFLWEPNLAFKDFTDMVDEIKNWAPFSKINPWVNYFPMTYIVLFPFTFIKNKIVAYVIFASLFLTFFLYKNILNFKCEDLTKLQNFQNIFVITFLSYPVIMLLDRGNIDMLLFILFVAFVYLFKSEKYLFSSVFIAVINAMKPFPLIFLVLFLFKKRYKEFFLSLIITAILVLGGFMVLKGGFSHQISIFLSNLTFFKVDYVYRNDKALGMFGGSSLFMMMKLFFTRLTFPELISTNLLTKIYSYSSMLVTPIILFFTWREKMFWKQISMLSLYMLTMPYLVNDYKLIFLFVPIWLFVNSKEKSKFDIVYSILFGLLFIPKNIIIQYHMPLEDLWFSLSIVINPIIMIIFMGLIIYEQFATKEKKGISRWIK